MGKLLLKLILGWAFLAILVFGVRKYLPLFLSFRNSCGSETKVCLDGTIVKRVPPKCEFAPCPEQDKRKVKLFFYNPNLDKDSEGNIKCSRDGLVAVEREIPFDSQNPIEDTLFLLLSGKLTEEEKASGITTEFPLKGFFLVKTSLEGGVLTLEFEDREARTSGGACRAGILWFQIEETAKQFPEVQEVKFLPETLFQP